MARFKFYGQHRLLAAFKEGLEQRLSFFVSEMKLMHMCLPCSFVVEIKTRSWTFIRAVLDQ